MPRSPTTIQSLVEGFADNIKALKAPGYKESQLRLHYLDPFWKLLGWDVENSAQLGPADVEVIVEPSVDSHEGDKLRSRRPDYIFRVGGTARFVVEAKKPAIDLDTDLDAIYQAKRYAWSSTIPFAILTDFEQFRVYDTSLKPHINHPDRGRVDDLILDYHQFPAQWDVLTATFGRDAVANHSLEKLRAKVRKIKPGRRIRAVDGMLIDLRGDEPVDKAFLACLDTHRTHFAQAIYRENRKLFPDADTLHGAARLTEAVQRLMDRLVFMRVCEDRDIAEWGALRATLKSVADDGGDLYHALQAEFRTLDRSYNGYLFKPHDFEEMEVDGAALSDFIRDLYPPDGPWDFAAIGDDILGIIYERFLGHVVTVRKHQATVEEKPEVRHAGGVYYTPRFIVDTIIRRVIGPKLSGETPSPALSAEIKRPSPSGDPPQPAERAVVTSPGRQPGVHRSPVPRAPEGGESAPRTDGPGAHIHLGLRTTIKNKSPTEVLDIKILDPACGSGSFLVAALQYLFDHCLAAVQSDPSLATAPTLGKGRKKKTEIAFQEKGRWFLAPDFRAALLTSCIHGVDIDQQAVEVTVMSLYLKMLESKLPENWQQDWVENRLLPPLDNNIRCGNSLIDPASYDAYLTYEKKGLFGEDEDTKFRINRFDWIGRARGFGRLLDRATDSAGSAAESVRPARSAPLGFDCIIGNPPYIRVQELNKWAAEECEFYKWKYDSAKKGNYDIYVVFTEKALSLLAPDGLLGFIMPHKFWQAAYGAGLRKVIAEGKHLRSLVDFRQEQVFRGATTYTAIHVLSKSANTVPVRYAATTRLIDGPVQMKLIDAGRKTEDIELADVLHPGAGSWSFVAESQRITTLLANSGARPLKQVARLAQGIKTSADKVFVFELEGKTKDHALVRSQQTGRVYEVEWPAVRPLIKSEHMKRFVIEESNKWLLFPYERRGEGYVPISPSRWKTELPGAWAYLNDVKAILEAREQGRMTGRADWYAYIYPKNFDVLSQPKLCIPDMSEHMQVCIDPEGAYIFSGGAAGGNAIVPEKPEMLPFLSGLLNSRLIEAQLRQTGTKFRGGYLNCEIRFIRDLPIKLPETKEDHRLADRITESVRTIMAAKSRLRAAKLSDRERDQLEAEVEAHEHRINEAVFRLYGVDGLPGA